MSTEDDSVLDDKAWLDKLQFWEHMRSLDRHLRERAVQEPEPEMERLE